MFLYSLSIGEYKGKRSCMTASLFMNGMYIISDIHICCKKSKIKEYTEDAYKNPSYNVSFR